MSDNNWLTNVGISAASAIAGGFGIVKWLDHRIDGKADKQDVSQKFAEVTEELGTQRGHIGKIFDQMRDAEKQNEIRHRELLMYLMKKGE